MKDLIFHFWTMILTGLVVIVSIPLLIRFLKRSETLDVPNNRSVHKSPIPSMGGIVFFSGLLFAIGFARNLEVTLFCSLIGASGILGFVHDRMDLSSKMKFVFQGLIAVCLYLLGFSVTPILELIVGISPPHYLDLALTVLFILGVVKAVNLIDGIDGLLVSITFASSIVLTIIFYLQGQLSYLYLSMAMIGVSASFLVYNFQPAKIFMGNTGSLLIGTYLSVGVLKVTEAGDPKFSIVGVALIIFCCVDMVRLFLGRYVITKKPFKADRNHFHYVLLRLGWSHRKIVALIFTLNLTLILTAFLLLNPDKFLASLVTLILCCVSFYGLLQFLVFRKHHSLWRKTIAKKNREIGNNQLLKSNLK
ncbi:MAG: undecaprenyl/decaprenyl-phosphate alpha-N-acetylglucosaminyl 1-phosphate transferase [Crocinitomicaceae bacterium]|nr:undecaprenyl/decaprenyl-phosphate alpha-N-acetylglucosaminyl 1-phosphate transferase [Crocinitomicaceae bacterium]